MIYGGKLQIYSGNLKFPNQKCQSTIPQLNISLEYEMVNQVVQFSPCPQNKQMEIFLSCDLEKSLSTQHEVILFFLFFPFSFFSLSNLKEK